MNRAQKLGFALMAVVIVTPFVLEFISNRSENISEADETIANRRATKIALREVGKLIRDGQYDDIVDQSTREQALIEDYAFFKMAARFND